GGSPTALAVDTFGNIYVSGHTLDQLGKPSVAIFKYDAKGRQVWATKYDLVAAGGSAGTKLALDSWGNVYVADVSDQPGAGGDFLITKYIQSWVDPVANGDFTVQLLAVPGQTNRIQSTSDL